MPDTPSATGTTDDRLFGTVLTLPGATAAELLAEPFGVVWIDLEHGALGRLEAQEMILGAQAADTAALVRHPVDAHELMAAMLDAGADGVVLAGVHEPAMLEAALARVAHPPDGARGWGPRRLGLRRRRSGEMARRPAVWAQIESAAGVAQTAAIAAVPGLDAIVVGTADLSFSLGTPLDVNTPAMVEAIEAIRCACAASGVAFGLAGALDTMPNTILASASILVHSTDARLCAGAVDAAADWLRTVLISDPETSERS